MEYENVVRSNPIIGGAWAINDGKFLVRLLLADGWVTRLQPFLSPEDTEELTKKQGNLDAVRWGKFVK